MGVDDAMVAEGNHCLLKGLVSSTEKERNRKKRQMTDFNWLEHKMLRQNKEIYLFQRKSKLPNFKIRYKHQIRKQ